MKRIMLWLAAFLLLALPAAAKSGDIAGTYYSTDICTFLNGAEIDAINIGGETLISAEDMQYYSFSVVWDAQARALSVESIPHAMCGVPPTVTHTGLPSGSLLGNYYETDIVTTLDGAPIPAYNLGGRTYLHAEAMRSFGYAVEWDASARTLTVTSPDRAGYVWTLPLTEEKAQAETASGSFAILWEPGQVCAAGDAEYFTSALHLNRSTYTLTLSFPQNGLPFSAPLLSASENAAGLRVLVNGIEAQSRTVTRTDGNGHTDISVVLDGIPPMTKSALGSVSVLLGDDPAAAVEVLDTHKTPSASEIILAKLGQNENDFSETVFSGEAYDLVLFYASPRLGDVTDHLYAVRKADLAVSGDLLAPVRKTPGRNFPLLRPFSFSQSGDMLTFSAAGQVFTVGLTGVFGE